MRELKTLLLGRRDKLQHGIYFEVNRPFPSSPQPPFQSEAKCKIFLMKISFHSY